MLKLMSKLTTLSGILFASFLLSSCVNPPKKPVGHIGGVNARSAGGAYLLNFNLETDFDADIKLKPGVQGVRKKITLDDLHKNWCLDASSKEELTRYGLQWKERYKMIAKQLDECRSGR